MYKRQTIHYAWLYISGGMPEGSEEIAGVIGKTATSATTSGGWHGVFMLCCIGLVIGGVRGGIERAAKVLMPILALVMVLIIGRGVMLDGFGEALSFVLPLDLMSSPPAACSKHWDTPSLAWALVSAPC